MFGCCIVVSWCVFFWLGIGVFIVFYLGFFVCEVVGELCGCVVGRGDFLG